MKTTVTESEFINDMTREWYGFSYDWARLLFDYLEDYEEQCDTEVEYDPVWFRCQYAEYDTEEYITNYQLKEDFKEYIKDYDLENESINKQYQEFFDDIIYNQNDFCTWDYETFIVSTY